jgi:pseudoazurin
MRQESGKRAQDGEGVLARLASSMSITMSCRPPGDTVTSVPADKGHNAETVVPDGAETFKGKINEEIKQTFSVPGVYVIKCTPHWSMGMAAVVVVECHSSRVLMAQYRWFEERGHLCSRYIGFIGLA